MREGLVFVYPDRMTDQLRLLARAIKYKHKLDPAEIAFLRSAVKPGMVALDLQAPLTLAGVPIAGLLSGLCGWFGMKMATNAPARTAFAAKQSPNDGPTVAFRSGAVTGLPVVGFALLDVSIWLFVLNSSTASRLPVLPPLGRYKLLGLVFAKENLKYFE